MKLGVETFFSDYTEAYSGKRIGLVTNMTGVDHELCSTIDHFYEHEKLNLVALYSPEHGIRGMAQAGEKVNSNSDPYTGLPVYSLYGDTRKPSADMLQNIDVMVYDLQDIGSRYYTYIYTMAYVMQACGEQGIDFVVLDRPNPIGGIEVEGNLVEPELRSFVGLYPIPNRHGLTVGELAYLFKGEFDVKANLTVIPMTGWSRSMSFQDTDLLWVPPSPNVTSEEMCLLYPGTCLIEGTNLSEGRGTTRPFEYIGAPFINGMHLAKELNKARLPGVIARPVSFKPTFHKFEDEQCEGVQLHITNRNELKSLEVGVQLLVTISWLYQEAFRFEKYEEHKHYFFDLLAGTKSLRKSILAGEVNDYLEELDKQSLAFKKQREPYLLYN
ncbi:exo-beta-N-acetylmuramidase NamZ family protein [Pontibacillus marinus]|uniref:DUF1343 domain-containing protein n=1 Tax=Pontibacillus marinus BH030004 = DSM 16465 TaxID=1385511 RepID=A0A0A5GIZ0_9BACI|nr:DUF1343 domain-containing protein [Pontibacillus marinus]KGX91193.1 hypothetical protein N783_10845 [Pontibacillus marinus BH030004 = DSM 16465]